VPAPAKNGFIPPIAAWKKALTTKTRAMVINYPANPTGVYPSREYLQEFQEFAGEHNLWVVSDNVRKGAALNALQIAELLVK